MNAVENLCERMNKYNEDIMRLLDMITSQRKEIEKMEKKISSINLEIIEMKKVHI